MICSYQYTKYFYRYFYFGIDFISLLHFTLLSFLCISFCNRQFGTPVLYQHYLYSLLHFTLLSFLCISFFTVCYSCFVTTSLYSTFTLTYFCGHYLYGLHFLFSTSLYFLFCVLSFFRQFVTPVL